MEHIIQLAISVEDERIVKRIEEQAEAHVLKEITNKVEAAVYERRYSYSSRPNNEPLKQMIRDCIDTILSENKDFILQEASKILADRLARSKAGKALLESGE